MIWYFLFFFVSGFCGILYEIVWLRLSMAQFGVTSALVSIVLSMFMGGLGLGSWASGWLMRRYEARAGVLGLRLYGLAELLIGISALLVPLQLQWGRMLLEKTGLPSSGSYYLASGVCVALTLVPWCACMGATIPLAMASIKSNFRANSSNSFSFLYLANVIGATVGAIIPLLLIELYGFQGTLKIGAVCNAALAVSAFLLSTRSHFAQGTVPQAAVLVEPKQHTQNWRPLVLLFATGLTSMGLEIVWIRQFTPYLGTMVYAFAAILALYLIATLLGSKVYRIWSRRHSAEPAMIWLGLGFCALLSLAGGDPSFRFPTFLRPIIGIVPFSLVLGFVTPMLVDRWSEGNPDRAGTAYATNVAGCILGPLLAGFVLLPLASEHWVICIFAIPWLLAGFKPSWLTGTPLKVQRPIVAYALALLALQLTWVSKDFETQFAKRIVLRDSTATIVAATSEKGEKRLLVNGVGITSLTPVTKVMAHLPMASMNRPPQNALNICFGMGTTFRSLLSWGVPTTSVELVPSVPLVFPYYHPDGGRFLQSPLAHVVIDDGRRYLERTSEQFDVITIDPPPPVEAAGSSMLYSKEFYAVLSQHLRKDGILQQWLPEGDPIVRTAVARALQESFPSVRFFQYFPDWGFQFLASKEPIPYRAGAELAARMPEAAARDFMEWPFRRSPAEEFNYVLEREKPLSVMLNADPTAQAMRDDRPVNEYVIMRKLNATHYRTDALLAWYERTKSP
jgi:predicted membrane-bound spermidine synthase